MVIRGPAHPINIPCPYCGAKPGEECKAKTRPGFQCPERERAMAERLNKLAEKLYGKQARLPTPGTGDIPHEGER